MSIMRWTHDVVVFCLDLLKTTSSITMTDGKIECLKVVR
jgi:hypothetical protein